MKTYEPDAELNHLVDVDRVNEFKTVPVKFRFKLRQIDANTVEIAVPVGTKPAFEFADDFARSYDLTQGEINALRESMEKTLIKGLMIV